MYRGQTVHALKSKVYALVLDRFVAVQYDLLLFRIVPLLFGEIQCGVNNIVHIALHFYQSSQAAVLALSGSSLNRKAIDIPLQDEHLILSRTLRS